MEKLSTFETNLIKQCLGLSTRSYTTPVLQATNIKSLGDAIRLRKFSMLMQLLNNEVTCSLILKLNEHNYSTAITERGYNSSSENGDDMYIRNEIAACCLKSMGNIRQEYRNRNKDLLTQTTELLLKNPSPYNKKLLQFLLQAKNKMRDFI